MQRKTKILLDTIKIIINIFMLVLMALSLVTKENNLYALYWIVVAILLIFEAYYLLKWSKIDEWNADRKNSNSIRYSFDGITTGTLCLSAFLYLVVMALELYNQSIKTNNFIVIIVSTLLTVSTIFNFVAVNTANRESRKLVEKIYKYKK